MKYREFITCLLLLGGAVISVASQPTGVDAEELQIGDTLSGEIVIDVHRDRDFQQTIGDYRGKWLLLDFWETYCAACIASMDKVNSLNRKFSDQLEIMLVTRSSAKNVSQFMARTQVIKGTGFSFVVRDALLHRLFPHRVIPHVVWIDPDGIVRGITAGEDVNEENIEAMLADKHKTLRPKKEKMDWQKYEMPDAGDDTGVIFRSVLKRYDAEIPQSGWFNRGAASYREDSVRYHTIDHVYFSNYTPLQLFYTVFMFWKYRGSGNINPYRIAIEVRDSVIRKQYANADLKIPFSPLSFPYMYYPDRRAYRQDNAFGYDLTLPAFLPDTLVFSYVFDDLNRYFPIKGKIEKRWVPVLVMKVVDSTKAKRLLKSKGGKPYRTVDNESIRIGNYPLKIFTKTMRKMRSKPIVDETGINDNIDIAISFKDSPYLDRKQGLVLNMLHFDEVAFAREMANYGIEVNEEKRWVDILVIYD